MRAYLGFIPIGVVIVPFAVAAVRQALFYKGCMDGYGFILVAMSAFMFGGLLNLVYLLFVGIRYQTYFDFSNRRQYVVAMSGFVGSLLLLIIQAVVVTIIAWKNLVDRGTLTL